MKKYFVVVMVLVLTGSLWNAEAAEISLEQGFQRILEGSVYRLEAIGKGGGTKIAPWRYPIARGYLKIFGLSLFESQMPLVEREVQLLAVVKAGFGCENILSLVAKSDRIGAEETMARALALLVNSEIQWGQRRANCLYDHLGTVQGLPVETQYFGLVVISMGKTHADFQVRKTGETYRDNELDGFWLEDIRFTSLPGDSWRQGDEILELGLPKNCSELKKLEERRMLGNAIIEEIVEALKLNCSSTP